MSIAMNAISLSPSPSPSLPCYTLNDVSLHCLPTDCWVIIFDKILNITPLIKEYTNSGDKELLSLLSPLFLFGGDDISHWFDANTHDVKKFIDVESGVACPYLPFGMFPHVVQSVPIAFSTLSLSLSPPWWIDSQYVIGMISRHPVRIELVSLLSGHREFTECGEEETIRQIQFKYFTRHSIPFDEKKNAVKYTWKYKGKILKIHDTIKDIQKLHRGNKKETDVEIEMEGREKEKESDNDNSEEVIPTIHIYFNDIVDEE